MPPAHFPNAPTVQQALIADFPIQNAINSRTVCRSGVFFALLSINLTHTPEKKAYPRSQKPFTIYTAHEKAYQRSVAGKRQNAKEKVMEKKTIREILSLIFRALALAMGVAVTVLSCLGALEVQTAVTLLGIGLACAGAAMLERR